jgi:hypothetical protein
MNIHPTQGLQPAFASWIVRRRKRIEAQMNALDASRFEELADLIEQEDRDRPPPPQSEAEEEEYRRMLRESEELAARLADIRGHLLVELRDIERQQVRGQIGENRSLRGGSLDGYV